MDEAGLVVRIPAIDVLLAIAAVVGALTIILKPIRSAALAILHMRDDWDDIRERLHALEELKPNHGSSIADKVQLLRERQEQIAAEQERTSALIEHIATILGDQIPDYLPHDHRHPRRDYDA